MVTLQWMWMSFYKMGGRFAVTPVYDGPRLRAGQRIKGPAIIEEPFTSIILHPHQELALDRCGNYRIEM